MNGPAFGFAPYDDNDDDLMARRQRFEALHPAVEITPPDTPGNAGQWHARCKGEILASWYSLECLLDDLSWRLDGR